MSSAISRFIVAFCLALLVYWGKSLYSPFSSRGQAREAVVVMDMQLQGDLIAPLRNGIDIPSKPPLFHWMAYSVGALFGELSEAAVRAPSLLCAALTIGVSFALLPPLVGQEVALLTVAIFGTTVEWIRDASVARVDMVFAFWLTVGFLATLKIVKARGEASSAWFIIQGISYGFTILTKGPTGLLLPWGATGLYLLLKRRSRPFAVFTPKRIALSLGISLALSAWWYVAAYLQRGDAFLEVSLLKENLARVIEIEGLDPGHQKPFYFSVVDLLVGFLPWSILAVPVLMIAVMTRDLRSLLIKSEVLAFSVCWLATFIVAVSMSASKRTVYLIPVYPSLALIVAYLFSVIKQRAGFPALFGQFARYLTIVLGTLLCALFIFLFFGSEDLFRQIPGVSGRYGEDLWVARAAIRESLLFLICLCGTLSALAATYFAVKRYELSQAIFGFAVALCSLSIGLNNTIFPQIAEHNSPQAFVEQLGANIPAGSKLYYYKNDFYSVIFYFRKNIPPISDIAELADDSESFILLAKGELQRVQSLLPRSSVLLESTNQAFYGKDKIILLKTAS